MKTLRALASVPGARRGRGAMAIEYALVAAFVAVMVAAAAKVGEHLSLLMAYVGDQLVHIPPIDPNSAP